jgi:RNA polymerase sigma-70 factor (ECF subfamily)
MDDRTAWLADAYPSAYRTAFLILRNRADAEEAVQDAFLRAWRFRDTQRQGAAPNGWLYRVVVNACCSKLRCPARRWETLADHHAFAVVRDRALPPDVLAGDADRARRVVAALDALPESLRIPVILRYYAGLTEQEISLAIGRRPGTVKSRLHEARRRMARDDTVRALVAQGVD